MSYTCAYRRLRAPALSRTHRALTHRALGLVQDLALTLDIIITVVMSADLVPVRGSGAPLERFGGIVLKIRTVLIISSTREPSAL